MEHILKYTTAVFMGLLLALPVFAQPPSSNSYQLDQYGVLGGNPNEAGNPSSNSYILPESANGGISGEQMNSGTFVVDPGFVIPGFGPVQFTQVITLDQGYRFVSSYIIPENPDMLNVLNDNLNENLDFVRNTEGNLLRKIGSDWVNGIGDWVTTEGYLFKMNDTDELSVTGERIEPTTPITVNFGYQFVSYLPGQPMDAMVAFESVIAENLDFIRNQEGNMIRKIGNEWVNGIGETMPGEFYLFKLLNEDELIYPEALKNEAVAYTGDPVSKPVIKGNAADPVYSIYLILGNNIREGDRIAAFDGDKRVGEIKINSGDWQYNAMPVFSTLESGKGFEAGNDIKLKRKADDLWEELNFDMKSISDAYDAKVYPEGDGVYSVAKISGLKSATVESKLVVSIKPNPAVDEVKIQASSTIKAITLYHQQGAVLERFQGLNSGEFKLNISTYPAGLYITEIRTSKGVVREKLIIQ
ncbi:MAG: T9SS type A sorting domain-containing protein [Bacteroidales bacterium]|nr:T9SS type A sorting domain-containing protein [Bacteroidales bacterium]